MHLITAYEGQAVNLPTIIGRNDIAANIMRLSRRYPFPVFRFRKGRLFAADVVGAVTLGRMRFEILPKISEDSSLGMDRCFLLNLLKAAGYVTRFHVASGFAQSSRGDFIELLISAVTEELVEGLRNGVPRRYFTREENLPTIKGKILFEKMAVKGYTPSHLIPVRYTPLIADNDLTRVLKWTVKQLFLLTHSAKNREMLAACKENLSTASDINCQSSHLSKLSFSRLEKNWSRTIEITKLLISEKSLDPTTIGNVDSFSMVMPISHLFERALRRILLTSLEGSKYSVTHHTAKKYMLQDCVSGEYSMRLRPDLVFKSSSGKIVGIADAKWKRLYRSKDSFGLKIEDLYQVASYLNQYRIEIGILIFPMMPWMKNVPEEIWMKYYRMPGSSTLICLLAIDIYSLLSTEKERRIKSLACLSSCVRNILDDQ